ncbi:replicative DNA helicase [Xenococcus sp. PCC 7305]|uniref:DnaB-like helicase N-terminal domain-containing protein n=1 Tax=Xenococcus sp. PCC 7305 TaxID=102125 RepID=UPI0002ABC3F5|nr:DnaB-like helicase N-terminal domain-containing protein [Xenococcus sp. PCC 7305]ELS04930.1 replicative DNA helicase [Xenococcus sp. PCC 7305]
MSNSQNLVNIEAEEAILGGILLDPGALARIKSKIKAAMFSVRSHRIIYKAMVELNMGKKPTDLMAVSTFLVDRELLDTVGGTTKLGQLLNRTVSAVNIDRYSDLIIDKWARRTLIEVGNKLVELGNDTKIELSELTESVSELVGSWANSTKSDKQESMIGNISYTAIARKQSEFYEETIKLEVELDLNSDHKAQIKKLQEQADSLFKE